MANIQYLLAAYKSSSDIPINVDATSTNYLKKQESDKATAETKIKKDDSVLAEIKENIEQAVKTLKQYSKRVAKAIKARGKARRELFEASLKHRDQVKPILKSAKETLETRKNEYNIQSQKIGKLKNKNLEATAQKKEHVAEKENAEMHEKNTIKILQEQIKQTNVIIATKEMIDSLNISSLPEHVRDNAKQFLQTIKKGINISINEPLQNSQAMQLATKFVASLSQKGKHMLTTSTKKIENRYNQRAQLIEQKNNYSDFDKLTDDKYRGR